MRGVAGLAAAVLASGLAACGPEPRHFYDNNDLELIAAYRAKETCSCLFVMRMSEDYCRAWTRARPNIATIRIDRERGTVASSALLLWGRRAQYLGEEQGCVLK